MVSNIKDQIKANIDINRTLLEDQDFLEKIRLVTVEIIASLGGGGKLITMGNGGSASQAQHFSAEIINKFRLERKALPAIALTADTASLTAISNDSGFDFVFSRQIEALAKEGDICVAITTSDSNGERYSHSANLYRGLKMARVLKLRTVGLVSRKTKGLLGLLDYAIVVPSSDTPRIQEAHGLAIHIICEEVEKFFVKK